MPLIQTSKDRAEMAQRAALIGGREGWPTPEWNKGIKRFTPYTPFFGSHKSSKDWPISGDVNGRLFTTFRVSTEFSKMVLGGRRITTYRHTAIVFPDICNGMPLFDLISKKTNWEEVQSTEKLWTPTGDPQFDLEMTCAANAPARQWVVQFLTPQVKQAARNALRANPSVRIRFAAQNSHLACWVNGKDARDANMRPLLVAMAELANAFAGAAPAQQPGPMGPGPQQTQYPQAAPIPQQPAYAAQQYAPPQQQQQQQPQYPYPQQPAPGYPAPQPMPAGYPQQPQPNQGPYPPQPGYPPQAPGPYPPTQPAYPPQPAPGYPPQYQQYQPPQQQQQYQQAPQQPPYPGQQ